MEVKCPTLTAAPSMQATFTQTQSRQAIRQPSLRSQNKEPTTNRHVSGTKGSPLSAGVPELGKGRRPGRAGPGPSVGSKHEKRPQGSGRGGMLPALGACSWQVVALLLLQMSDTRVGTGPAIEGIAKSGPSQASAPAAAREGRFRQPRM